MFGILRSSDSFTVVLFRFLRIELVSIVFILMFADSFYIVLIRFYQLNRGISTRIVFFQSAWSGPDCLRWINVFDRPDCRPESPQKSDRLLLRITLVRVVLYCTLCVARTRCQGEWRVSTCTTSRVSSMQCMHFLHSSWNRKWETG